MSLTSEEVAHIARLARVGMSVEDIERYQAQLSVILDAFEALRALDTEGVPPTAHTLQLSNVFRPDKSRPSFPVDAMLANAPQTDNGFIRVRRVLE